MTADARMIGVNQEGDSAESMCLDLGWVGVMKDQGFEACVADVGGPLLSTSTVLSVVEAARINRVFKARATRELARSRDSVRHTNRDEIQEMVEELIEMQIQCADRVEELLERIGRTQYFSAWIIVETANID